MLWMAVTADDLELPVVVEKSAKALARAVGTTEDNIRVKAYRNRKAGRRNKREGRYRYYAIKEKE